MSMRPQHIPDIPKETVQVARAAFPKGNIYMQIRDTLGSIYEDEAFVELFSQRGQSAESPWRLALICVMQFVENLSDRQAAEQAQQIALQSRRQVQQTPEWNAIYNQRAGIEATHSQGIRRSALRRSRYIGLDKTHLQHILIATALNLVRLNDWLSEVPFAKTRFSRFKQLQPEPA